MGLRPPGAILLISCYELGHQPLSVAMPMAFLQRAGFSPDVIDIAIDSFDADKAATAKFIAISVPMHTALRLGVRVAERIREVNPDCRFCFYGLYAALNSDYLLDHGADFCIGGECEGPLVELVESIENGTSDAIEGVIQRDKPSQPFLKRLPFTVADRSTLPPLEKYARLEHKGTTRICGYVEASRGCLHLCTHCPIPPVYEGRFFAVPADVVLEDIRQQVAAGATHITFGDPDFLNGPMHSLRVVRAMHKEFPDLTFDFTAKVEHLLGRGEHLQKFADAGCLFIISAVESLSDRVLDILAKNHTRADVEKVWDICRSAGIALRPTWVAFTPWTTLDDFIEVLEFIEANDLVDHVDAVQFSIRLLIPPGSWITDLPETQPHLGALDETAFTYRWSHPDPRMDQLQKDVAALVERDSQQCDGDLAATFFRIKELAHGRKPDEAICSLPSDRFRAPRLTESWFC